MVNKKILDKLLKQKEYHDKIKEKYYTDREVKIYCSFCGSLTNLWSLNNHMKGIKCMELKEILLKDKPEMMDQLKLKVNQLKKDLKYKKDE